jgi:hypothetical protein
VTGELYYTASACEDCGAPISGVPYGAEHALCGSCLRAARLAGDPYALDPPWQPLDGRDQFFFSEAGPL